VDVRDGKRDSPAVSSRPHTSAVMLLGMKGSCFVPKQICGMLVTGQNGAGRMVMHIPCCQNRVAATAPPAPNASPSPKCL